MQIQNTTATNSTSNTATMATTTRKPSQEFDFMKLIVAQMKNLNPMDGGAGQDSLPTMMQAESLNQLTTLNRAIKDLQTMQQTSYGSSLIGKQVSGVAEGETVISGTVKSVKVDAGGPLLELTSGRKLRLLDVTEVGAG